MAEKIIRWSRVETWRTFVTLPLLMILVPVYLILPDSRINVWRGMKVLYYYTRAPLRKLSALPTEPIKDQEFTFLSTINREVNMRFCRVCGGKFWATGESEVCGKARCYVKDKMGVVE